MNSSPVSIFFDKSFLATIEFHHWKLAGISLQHAKMRPSPINQSNVSIRLPLQCLTDTLHTSYSTYSCIGSLHVLEVEVIITTIYNR